MGRGRTGQMQAHRTIGIRQSLVDAFRLPPAPPPEPKPPRPHKVSDELVALVRGDRELRGMTHSAIALKRGLSKAQVAECCHYRGRINIDPK